MGIYVYMDVYIYICIYRDNIGINIGIKVEGLSSGRIIYGYICIYGEREREREREIHIWLIQGLI